MLLKLVVGLRVEAGLYREDLGGNRGILVALGREALAGPIRGTVATGRWIEIGRVGWGAGARLVARIDDVAAEAGMDSKLETGD